MMCWDSKVSVVSRYMSKQNEKYYELVSIMEALSSHTKKFRLAKEWNNESQVLNRGRT